MTSQSIGRGLAMGRARAALVLATAGVALAGCSSTASNILTTGSVFGGGQTTGANAAGDDTKPVTAIDRALQVATISARAQKCGYVFDPAALRSNFLAAEAARGLPATELPGLEQRYDFVARKVASAIAPQEAYCSSKRTEQIKADLNRHLVGDYDPRQQRKVAASGGLLDIFEPPEGKEVLNPDYILDPGHEQPTVIVEE